MSLNKMGIWYFFTTSQADRPFGTLRIRLRRTGPSHLCRPNNYRPAKLRFPDDCGGWGRVAPCLTPFHLTTGLGETRADWLLGQEPGDDTGEFVGLLYVEQVSRVTHHVDA